MMGALSTVLSAGQIIQLYRAYSKAKSEVQKFLKWMLWQIWFGIVFFFKALIKPCQLLYVERVCACLPSPLSLTQNQYHRFAWCVQPCILFCFEPGGCIYTIKESCCNCCDSVANCCCPFTGSQAGSYGSGESGTAQIV